MYINKEGLTMKKRKNTLFKILNVIKMFFIVIFVMLIIFILNGSIECANVNSQIAEFKSRAEWVSDKDTQSFYKVVATHDYEIEDLKTRRTYSPSANYIGSIGDILITSRNPMQGVLFLDWPIGMFSKYFYVGHSVIISEYDGSMVYESEGKLDKKVLHSRNNWAHSFTPRNPTIIGLRVKTDIETINKALEYCEQQLGKPYNPTFLFNRANSYYCTDLISRAYEYAGLNVNYDYLATTGNDMTVSNNTYMFFYMEQRLDENNEIHYDIYYLSED